MPSTAKVFSLCNSYEQNANMMSLLGLSKKWKELVGKAKAKQLKPDEYTGGTFTITNLGMFGEFALASR